MLFWLRASPHISCSDYLKDVCHRKVPGTSDHDDRRGGFSDKFLADKVHHEGDEPFAFGLCTLLPRGQTDPFRCAAR